jgi:multidrug efflux system membrane fusion protein
MPAAKVSVAKVLEQPVNEWDEFTGRLEARKPSKFVHGSPARSMTWPSPKAPWSRKATCCSRSTPSVPGRGPPPRSPGAQAGQRHPQRKRSPRGERLRTATRSPPNWPIRAPAPLKKPAPPSAQLDLAKLNLSFTRVTAPISGRVSRAEITAGNLVTADTTALTSVVSTDKVYAYFDADERVFLKYTQLARRANAAPPPRCTWACPTRRQPAPGPDELRRQPGQPAHRHHPWPRRVRQQRRQYTPGLYARLKLVGSGTYNAMLINDEAVGTDLGKKFVLVMDKDNKTAYRAVELGPKLEGLRIVRSGLNKDDTIIVKGLQRVRPARRSPLK